MRTKDRARLSLLAIAGGILLALLGSAPGAASARGAAASACAARNCIYLPQVVHTTADTSHLAENWLDRLNAYRKAAGLGPVTENQSASADLAKHANYMLLNVASEGLWHGETAGRPGYSPEGNQAASESNLIWYSGNPNATAANAIDNWMASLPHRFGMLNHLLRTTGFAFSCVSQACAAGLNVLRGLDPGSPPAPSGVEYPGRDQVGVDPAEVMGGISWQFDWQPTAALTSATLRDSQGNLVPVTLTSPAQGDYFNMVSIQPRAPVSPHTTYTAEMHVTLGTQPMTCIWSFTTR